MKVCFEERKTNNGYTLFKKVKIKKKFILNYMFFYRKKYPEKLSDEEIKKYGGYKVAYIYVKPLEKREGRVPVEEFNAYTAFFNANTTKWLETANFENLQKRLGKRFFWQPFVYFTTKLYRIFDQRILNYLLIDGSLTNMLHGMRQTDDMDIAVVAPESIQRDRLYKFILENKKTIKYSELDVYLKDVIDWENDTPNVLNEYAKDCGAKDYDTLVASGDYNFYFNGIKIINYNLYIIAVAERAYPKNVFDTIQARRVMKIKYPLKPFDLKDDNAVLIKDHKSYSVKKFLKTITFYYRKFLCEKVTIKQVKLFLKPHFKMYEEEKKKVDKKKVNKKNIDKKKVVRKNKKKPVEFIKLDFKKRSGCCSL